METESSINVSTTTITSQNVKKNSEIEFMEEYVAKKLAKLPDISDQVERNNLLDGVEKGFQEFYDNLNIGFGKESDGKWEYIQNRNGAEIYRKVNDNHPIKSVLGDITVTGYSLKELIDFNLSWDYARHYDKYFLDGYDFKRLDYHTYFSYFQYKAIFPISNRDFVCVTSIRYEHEKKRVAIIMRSIEDEKFPLNPNFVRADVVSSGAIIEFLDEDDDTGKNPEKKSKVENSPNSFS